MKRALTLGVLALALCGAGAAVALTPVARVDLSPDVTQVLDSQAIADEAVAADDVSSGTITPANLGALPASGDVTAYHMLANGDHLLSFDVTVVLPGPLTAEPGDVVRYDGASYTLEFDASAYSVPRGAHVDAVALAPGGNLLLSFDTTLSLSGATFDDEDLVEFGSGTFSSYFDGSAAGIARELDLDGAHVFASNGNLALSFDTSGEVGGVSFSDEDVLEYDPASASWEMAWDASLERPEWNEGTDTDAVHFVPEPTRLVLLAAGVGLLTWLRRRGVACSVV